MHSDLVLHPTTAHIVIFNQNSNHTYNKNENDETTSSTNCTGTENLAK